MTNFNNAVTLLQAALADAGATDVEIGSTMSGGKTSVEVGFVFEEYPHVFFGTAQDTAIASLLVAVRSLADFFARRRTVAQACVDHCRAAGTKLDKILA